MLMLQRQATTAPHRWRNIARFDAVDVAAVLDTSASLASLTDLLAMRVVIDDARQEQIATWSRERGWRVLG